MNTAVVPEPSERWQTVMATSDSFGWPGTACSLGSFQREILPRKMSARSSGVSFTPAGAPLYTTATAPSTVGMCWMPGALASSASVIGASEAPKSTVGAGKAVKWPTGLGGKGNEGVTGSVKSTPGSIGYVELAYANQNKLTMAALKNADGVFVLPSIEGTSEAAAGVEMPADFRVSITNAPGDNAYPISSFTWLLLYENPKDKAMAKTMVEFVKWALTDGQKMVSALDYAPLPKATVAKVEQALRGITVGGKSVIASN